MLKEEIEMTLNITLQNVCLTVCLGCCKLFKGDGGERVSNFVNNCPFYVAFWLYTAVLPFFVSSSGCDVFLHKHLHLMFQHFFNPSLPTTLSPLSSITCK